MSPMRVKTLSPVVLAASVSLPTAPGPSVGLGSSGVDLQNSAKTPILIDEVRFRVQRYQGLGGVPASQDYGTADSGAGGAGVIGVKLSLGSLQLTADKFIPLGLLCQPLDPGVEAANGVNGYIGWARGSNAFTWKLPKPLYLPGSETIIPSFKLVGDFGPAGGGGPGSSPFRIDVAFIGRALASDTPKPTSVPVPFVTHWRDVIRQGAADYRGVKSDRELQNPYAENLMVQRISGGLLQSAARLGGGLARVPAFPIFSGYTLYNTPSLVNGFGRADQVANELVTARIVKSDGQPMVRDAVPWGYLFPPNTRSFDVLALLKQGEFYQVQADILLSSVFSSDVTVQIMAAIIGYRKIAYDPTVAGYGYMEAA